MSDINTVALTGRLGSDVELRHTPSGNAVADINLAVSGWSGKEEKTNWIGLTLWGQSAESAAKHLSKGRKIAVSGRLDQEEWNDKETGKKQRKTRVVVDRWAFADSQPSQQQQAPQRREQASQPANRASEAVSHADHDDIPF